MASQASLILQDLVQALRQSRLFASVSLGASGDTRHQSQITTLSAHDLDNKCSLMG